MVTSPKEDHLEDPEVLPRVLGRNHVEHQGGFALESSDFAKQCVDLYTELTGKNPKPYKTPHVDQGSIIEADDHIEGALSASAANILMKLMWLARISRPDLLVAINHCTTHIVSWNRNCDKRVARIIGYLSITYHLCIKCT